MNKVITDAIEILDRMDKDNPEMQRLLAEARAESLREIELYQGIHAVPAPHPVNRAERRTQRFRPRSEEARKLRNRTVLVQSLESYLDL